MKGEFLFDLVWVFYVLYYVDDLLIELWRLWVKLKFGGVCIIRICNDGLLIY